MAYDGDMTTFFDGLEGGYVTLDLGKLCNIGNIAYCPREDYEYRMIGGFFSVSADGINWKKIYTVETKPAYKMNFTPEFDGINAQYVRYEVPEGAPASPLNKDSVYLCNVAEIAVYGTAGADILKGDVNNDGSVTVSDLVSYQRYLLKNEALSAPENADINGDGAADVFDMIGLRKLVVSKLNVI